MENGWPNDDQNISDNTFSVLNDLLKKFKSSPELSFVGTGSIATKESQNDVYGDEVCVLHSANPIEEPFRINSYAQAKLSRIITLKNPSPKIINKILRQSCWKLQDQLPEFELIYHSLVPGTFTAFCSPVVLMAMDMCINPSDRFGNLFEDSLVWIDAIPGMDLARKLASWSYSKKTAAIFVHQFGLFTFGPDSKMVYDRAVSFVRKAEYAINFSINLKNNKSQGDALIKRPENDKIASLRKQVSLAAGTPLLTQIVHHQNLRELIKMPQIISRLHNDTQTYGQALRFENAFLNPTDLPENLSFNNALIHPEFGLVITGKSVHALIKNRKVASDILDSIHAALYIDSLNSQTPKKVTNYSDNPDQEKIKSAMFEGEIALVTGAASGIGRGCVLSLLNRGAIVVGLDINPEIINVSNSPAYLGIKCNLLDERAVKEAFDTTVRSFGGLDMVVLNAGVFPESSLIEELDIALWHKAMNINLNANVYILREAYTHLKKSPKNGRVVVNASRNVPAPGPGAAAYSTSKAGLTQLARVAALEWGQDGIRVNIIHPHAVFDTGIWTEEVLKSRAAKYGISVQEYKTNNLLKVQLTSHDIGELVCEMMGPVFSKTTGAQIPIDGGSDRVI